MPIVRLGSETLTPEAGTHTFGSSSANRSKLGYLPSGVHASAFKEGAPWRLREAEGMRCTSSIPPPTRISILLARIEVPIVASRHRCIAKPLPNQVNAGDARAWPPTPFAAVQQTRANELPAAQRLLVPILCRIVKLSRLATYRHCTFQSGPQGQPLETHAPSHANLSILITLRAYSRPAAAPLPAPLHLSTTNQNRLMCAFAL